MLGLIQTPNFSWAEPNSNSGWPKLLRMAELIQTPILIAAELNPNKGEKQLASSGDLKSVEVT